VLDDFKPRNRHLLAVVFLANILATAGGQSDAEPVIKRLLQRRANGQPRGLIFVDAVFAYNFNQPVDHGNFFSGVGISAKRDNELSINLAQVDFIRAPEPVGFHLALGYGTATEVVHAAEVRGVAVHPDIWRNIVRASLQWQTDVGRGLLLEAGLYPSHVGMEACATKDKWNYTRSWRGELSPYYQAEVKAAYPIGEHWSAQLQLLNGWQTISDGNRGKSAGGQIAYDRPGLAVGPWVSQ
jgi:hypothetical protein